MLRVHRVKGEGPGFSSMSPDRRTNKKVDFPDCLLLLLSISVFTF